MTISVPSDLRTSVVFLSCSFAPKLEPRGSALLGWLERVHTVIHIKYLPMCYGSDVKCPAQASYMIEHSIPAGGSALGDHGTFRRWSLPEEVDCRDGPKDSCPIPLPDLTWNKQIHTPAALKPHAFSCASPPWTASLPAVNQINPSDLRMFLLGVLSQPCDEQLMHTVWQLLCA